MIIHHLKITFDYIVTFKFENRRILFNISLDKLFKTYNTYNWTSWNLIKIFSVLLPIKMYLEVNCTST